LAEEERIRLMQDLHDGLLQTLTGAALQLRNLQTLIERDPERAVERLSEVREAIASEQRELRFWASDMKQSLARLREEGVELEERLRTTLDRISGTWGTRTELVVELEDELPPVLSHQVYSIVQEAVVN